MPASGTTKDEHGGLTAVMFEGKETLTAETLVGTTVVTLAINVPGPVAAARLRGLGATVVKVEPPGGDPLREYAPSWYRELCVGQEVLVLDLKRADAREVLDRRLVGADVLLTSQRPQALARLGLGRDGPGTRYTGLAHVAIVGHSGPRENEAGHDLTYLAASGLLTPPDLPRTLVADLAGAERTVSTVLALLFGRHRSVSSSYAEVSLADVAQDLAAPYRHGLTSPGGVLGGGLPFYGIYEARDGWIALASLEQGFRTRLEEKLGLSDATPEALAAIFLLRDAHEWEAWARDCDVPLAAVRWGEPSFRDAH